MKVTGTVTFRDIETGVWVLESDDGRTYLLRGGDRKLKKSGARVEAEGTVSDEISVAMVGPSFHVASYRFL